MSDGTTVPVTGTWTATGGTVDSAGVYTAGSDRREVSASS